MNIEKLLELASAAGENDRRKTGQFSLGRLRDELSKLDESIPCRYENGFNFGYEPVDFRDEEAWEGHGISVPAHVTAFSKTSYPSCYRGYYADCTFNAEKEFPVSTVGHVLKLVNSAIGKSFNGYKGGVNKFEDSTLVWGDGTSHDRTVDSSMVTGVKVVDGVCLIETTQEED